MFYVPNSETYDSEPNGDRFLNFFVRTIVFLFPNTPNFATE
jgi:hypothetical protein